MHMAATGEPIFRPSPVEFVGPFEHHEVVVNGWRVPNLSAEPLPGGRVHLSLDHRFGIDLTVADAEQVVPFIADCMAVAMGYTCHPQEDWDAPLARTPFVRMRALGGLTEA